MTDTKTKIGQIQQVSNDITWLNEEYERIKLWGSCPDGDVHFDKFIDWLGDNADMIECFVKLAKDLKDTGASH